MSGELLKEVSRDELPQVLEELKKDWPRNFLLHQYIQIMEEYKKTNKHITQILYRHGRIENSIYIFKTLIPIGLVVTPCYFVGTTSTNLSDISKVLTESSEISLSEFLFEIIFSQFTPYVKEALTSKGLQFMVDNNIMMWLPPEDGLDVGVLPEDVYLKSLEACHIPEINENWPHKHPGSDEFLATELQLNFGLGLFTKSDNKLLSSSISLHSGGIFILHTHPDHRRKGYAGIIVRHMAQEIRNRGRIPFGTIIATNIPSLNLFRKIGFKEFSKIEFIKSKSLFTKSDNQLLSSSISLHSGGIFILHTHPDHRRKGYAQVIVCHMAQEIRNRGRIPFGYTDVKNIPSQSLFRKIGFKEFLRVDFIQDIK